MINFKEIQEILNQIDLSNIEKIIEFLNLNKDKTIFSCGCGGAFNISQHWAEDGISYLINQKKPPLKTIALGSNVGLVTAIGNDFGFNYIFSKELEAIGNSGDILICFSGSGNSKCLLEAASSIDGTVISFTGFDGGELGKISDFHINIPSEKWAIIHSLQSLIFHMILDAIV